MDLNLSSKFEKIITGQAEYKSPNLSCNLLITRMKKQYEKNPNPQQLAGCKEEMNKFFEKYSSIMTAEIEKLNKL